MAKRKKSFLIEKIDILTDIKNPQEFPWKYKDNSVKELTCVGVFEFIPGKLRGAFMDEVYRILIPDGKAAFSVVYWNTARGVQDFRYEWPPLCEQSFLYFNKAWREINKLNIDMVCDFDFCIAPETLVLTHDLRWVRADSIKVGDSIIGVSEFLPYKGAYRRMMQSKVEFIRNFNWKRYKITTDCGEIITTPEHPFLARTKGRTTKWIPADKLRINDRIKFIGKPWLEDFSNSWLTGIYDAEGCVVLPQTKDRYTGMNLTIAQKSGIVFDKSLSILESELGCDRVHIYDKTHDLNGCKSICICGIAETLRILGKYRPLRLISKIKEIISSGRLGLPSGMSNVINIEQLDDGPVVAIRSSTKTLITNGFVSHNTYGYTPEAETAARNEESRSFYIKHYTNCIDALHLMLTKRPEKIADAKV